MKMPENMDKQQFAPCGVDCNVCWGHLRKKNPCSGCLSSDAPRPKCVKKQCAKNKGLTYCFECDKHPCAKIKTLDKRYQNNYQSSLIENNNYIKQYGFDKFYRRQKLLFTCKKCGGVIDVHHKKCSECGAVEE